MFAWTDLLLAVFIGFVLAKIWNMILYTGYAVIILKDLQKDSAKLLFSVSQMVYEIEELKKLELQRQGKTDKEIDLQMQYHKKSTKLMKNMIVSSFVNNWPRRYGSILQFNDWQSAMDYLDKLVKEERESKRR